MSSTDTTSTCAHADDTGLTSPSPPSPARMVAMVGGLPAPARDALPARGKTPLPTRGKQQVAATKSSPPRWLQSRSPRSPYNSKEIISIGNMPSNAQLKSMKSKPYIRILWKTNPKSESVLLYEAFPKALAVAFSENCRQATGNTVVIEGSFYFRVKEIFNYMLDSAKGQGCAPPSVPEHLRYCTYVARAVDASVVNVPLLEEEYEARRIIIENMQVHSEDVEEVYRDATSKGMQIRIDVATSIARKIASKELKAYMAYKKLREELPEFDADIKKALPEFLKPLKDKWRQEAREARQQAQRQAWAQQQKDAHQARATQREEDAAGRVNTIPRVRLPPVRNPQPRTSQRVMTSLGVIWAEVPSDKNPKDKASKGPKMKIDPAKKATEANKSIGKDVVDGKTDIVWADEMEELSEEERRAAAEKKGKGGLAGAKKS